MFRILSAAFLALELLFCLSGCGGKPSHGGGTAVATVNKMCPVMGAEVQADDPELVLEYQGMKIGFCCDGCPQKFKKDPEKYMDKMRKDPVKYGFKP